MSDNILPNEGHEEEGGGVVAGLIDAIAALVPMLIQVAQAAQRAEERFTKELSGAERQAMHAEVAANNAKLREVAEAARARIASVVDSIE